MGRLLVTLFSNQLRRRRIPFFCTFTSSPPSHGLHPLSSLEPPFQYGMPQLRSLHSSLLRERPTNEEGHNVASSLVELHEDSDTNNAAISEVEREIVLDEHGTGASVVAIGLHELRVNVPVDYTSVGEVSVNDELGDVSFKASCEATEQVSAEETEALEADLEEDMIEIVPSEDQNNWLKADECLDQNGAEGFMQELFKYDRSLEANDVTGEEECQRLLTLEEVKEVLENVRARDVCVLNVEDRCEWTNTMVFATGISDRHVRGIADALIFKIKKKPYIDQLQYPIVEGGEKGKWLLVDCGGIVIHVLSEEARAFYKLEEFWSDKQKYGDADQELQKMFKLGRLKPSTRHIQS